MSTPIAITQLDSFIYGHAPKPVRTRHGLEIGAGTVIPEINFTLPTMSIDASTWDQVCAQYRQMIEGVLARAGELDVPGLLVEFETLPPMTDNPAWGLEITRILADAIADAHRSHGLRGALRLTPNDTRENCRPPQMRRGKHWDAMQQIFQQAAAHGADMLAIESTGGKEICDEALMQADLRLAVFALGCLGARDMAFLWGEIVAACRAGHIIPAGDTACGFANTAMVLAEQRMVPRIFAALVRVASVPRSLVAYEVGAVGPSKDCAYEGPYMKAIAGVPISMEGRTAACAHLSPVGNVSQAVCDCWSNESVQNLRLLSTYAPTVSVEQLAYDCRLLNTAAHSGGACQMRDWLTDSDSHRDPQAFVLRPDIVLDISTHLMQAPTPYLRTVAAVRRALELLRQAVNDGTLALPRRESNWLHRISQAADDLPDHETTILTEIMDSPLAQRFIPTEYGIDA